MELSRRTSRGPGSLAAAVLAAALPASVVLAACNGSGSPATRRDGSVYIRYVGNPAGVYDAYCFPVRSAPDGHIVTIDKLEKVNVIDATYEYLPDGLKVDDPRAVVRYYDCKDYDLHPAPSTTTTSDTTPESTPETAPETTPETTAPTTVAG
jgi:hypothetical protein